jgi:RimJ/RimL family protein N-acetyltransferase
MSLGKYLFQSPRLGFRLWQEFDLEPFAAINADPEVMRYFQKTFSKQDTQAFMERMKNSFADRGYCYFAVDLLETKELIGTMGLGWKTFEADFTPCVDIGWRIGKKWWNQGLTSEGAKACLEFAKALEIPEVYSYATVTNLASIQVMKKIGMKFSREFDYAEMKDHPHLLRCALYHIDLLSKEA